MTTSTALKLHTVKNAAALLSVGVDSVYNLISAGLLDAIDVKASGERARVRVTEDSIQRFLHSRRITTPGNDTRKSA